MSVMDDGTDPDEDQGPKPKPIVTIKEDPVWAPMGAGRHSEFTEEEMKILVHQVRRHMQDPKVVTLHAIATTYGVAFEQIQRIRARLRDGRTPFRTHPSKEKRKAFSNRMPNPPETTIEEQEISLVELGEKRMRAIQKENQEKEDRKIIKPFDRIREILLKSDPGKPIAESTIHDILRLVAGTTSAEGNVIKALLASQEIKRQSGQGERIGPPPPLTDGEQVQETMTILRAVGMDITMRAVRGAFGGAVLVSKRRARNEGTDVDLSQHQRSNHGDGASDPCDCNRDLNR